MKTSPISVRVPPEVKKALEAAAAKQDRSLSWLVAKALKDSIAKQTKAKG